MIVSISGYGATGSSAVIDLLKEYEEIDYPRNNEFELLYLPGGIINIDTCLNDTTPRYHLSDYTLSTFRKIIEHSKNANNPFNKFTDGKFYDLASDYFDKICDCKWDGIVSYDHYFINKYMIIFRYAIVRRIEKILGPKLSSKLKIRYFRKMYFSIKPKNFLENTKEFLDKVFISAGYQNNKIKMVNQLFAPNYIKKCYKYIKDECKTIVVRRDPRDLYISVCKLFKSQNPFAPDDLDQFIVYYKKMYDSYEKDKTIIYINFEDLIYNYDKTISQIESFLGIKNHIKQKYFFKPELSKANTMLYKRYKEYNDDIKKIEIEFKDYLYDFSSEEVDYSIDPFICEDE